MCFSAVSNRNTSKIKIFSLRNIFSSFLIQIKTDVDLFNTDNMLNQLISFDDYSEKDCLDSPCSQSRNQICYSERNLLFHWKGDYLSPFLILHLSIEKQAHFQVFFYPLYADNIALHLPTPVSPEFIPWTMMVNKINN